MSKRKPGKGRASTPASTPAKAAERTAQSERRPPAGHRSAAVRETIESIVIAFIAAFLVRTFEAEAFVIPTGSMAPTLMGRHKDVECPVCGYFYRVSASSEVDQNTGEETKNHVRAGTCPMCRYTADLGRGYPAYSGDRILVGKFAYELGEPERWDVLVFKYPGDATTNYIKRLVGLPGETVRIQHGDIFVRRDDGVEIARKSPRKLLAMLQPVFDNRYAPKIIAGGWPPRWTSASPEGEPGAFRAVDPEGCLSFETDGSAPAVSWLRYHHRVPSFSDWQQTDRGQVPPGLNVPPQLIADMLAYNTGRASDRQPPKDDAMGTHWVGDLALECRLEVISDSGEAVLELIEGGVSMQCRFDLATGQARLSVDGLAGFEPTAETAVRGPGTYDVRFANCDDRLYLWVDGRSIEFDTPATFLPLRNNTPTDADLAPAGVGSRGANLRVTDLVVRRDIYYIAANRPHGPVSDFRYPERRDFDNPVRWGATHSPRFVEFTLDEDQFFMLGDNSARSKDSRLWAEDHNEHFVWRDALTGKALFIYWPHSQNRIPGTPIPFPFFPNFSRMHFVE